MKAVLISIKPKYCELIANGKKTIEVRKSHPMLEKPFKCYIYCTKAKDIFSIGGGIYDYKDNLYRLPTGEIKFGDSFELMGDWRGQYDENNFLNGKVIGEFVCDRIIDIPYSQYFVDYYHTMPQDDLEATCLSLGHIDEYLLSKNGYGWHISKLVIYDKPKEVRDFYHINLDYTNVTRIRKAPQSWMYCLESEETE